MLSPVEAYHRLETELEGKPDEFLTTALIVIGISIILVALYSPSKTLKATALAYTVLP